MVNKEPEDRLEVVIPTRLCKSDASKVQRLADKRHITAAAWVRLLILKALKTSRV